MNSVLTIEDFAPVEREQGGSTEVASTRPSLSFWQDTWRRFKTYRRSMVSLYTIIFLLLFTLIGPLLWQVDPGQQELDQISQAPNLGVAALIVDDDFKWPSQLLSQSLADQVEASEDLLSADRLGKTSKIQLVDEPNTEYVRLTWLPVKGAATYLIYRNEHQPVSNEDLGVPLWETDSGQQLFYQDRLKLEAIPYFYSVVATDGVDESELFLTVEADVRQAITFSDALYRRLILVNDSQKNKVEFLGQTVKLAAHPFGTDYLGRDLMSRMMLGARTSLFIGIVAPILFLILGVAYGSIAGFIGGRLDEWMMRFADFVIALPFLLFMILFKVAFGIGPGESGIMPMLVAMVLLSWPSAARLVRGQVMQLREQPYIQAAQLMGAPRGYLIIRHMLPNIFGVILVSLTFAVPSAIFTEAFLSFIGMGVVPPTPSWGSLSNDGIKTIMTHPHELLIPAIFIAVTVLAFNLLGDGLRDALDVKLRNR